MRKGFTLISTLATIAIILILVAAYFTGGFGTMGAKAGAKGPIGQVKRQTSTVELRSNLQQVRAAIEMRAQSEDGFPASLDELGLPEEVLKCPVGKQRFQYDPATGRVWSPTPGYENL
ncbi:MAG: type II secretion system protein [Fimbriimonadaceae bacterium]|nr:type II secretion system protein [Fimbriimonadaceae bacterium]